MAGRGGHEIEPASPVARAAAYRWRMMHFWWVRARAGSGHGILDVTEVTTFAHCHAKGAFAPMIETVDDSESNDAHTFSEDMETAKTQLHSSAPWINTT